MHISYYQYKILNNTILLKIQLMLVFWITNAHDIHKMGGHESIC
jgi:hypothetical protein